jgi:hypothetical protein
MDVHALRHLAVVVLLFRVPRFPTSIRLGRLPRPCRATRTHRPSLRFLVLITATPSIALPLPPLALLGVLVRVDVGVHPIEVFSRQGKRPPSLVDGCIRRRGACFGSSLDVNDGVGLFRTGRNEGCSRGGSRAGSEGLLAVRRLAVTVTVGSRGTVRTGNIVVGGRRVGEEVASGDDLGVRVLGSRGDRAIVLGTVLVV